MYFVSPASYDLLAFLKVQLNSLSLVSVLKSCGPPSGQFKYSPQASCEPADLYPSFRQVSVQVSSTSCSLCSMAQQPMHFLPQSGFWLLHCLGLFVAPQARYHLSPLGPCSSFLAEVLSALSRFSFLSLIPLSSGSSTLSSITRFPPAHKHTTV